jgi:asparagine synthase (glutamine-hydrolysing)
MRTNGFALFVGERAPERAREAARRVDRYSKQVVVSTDGEFRELEGARLSGKKQVVVAYSLGGGGLPLVHGSSGDAGAQDGEFSILGRGASGFYGARDPLGTRGLWAVERGPGAGSMASDYRLLRKGAALQPPGATYAGGKAEKVARRRPEVPVPRSFEEAARELASLIEEAVKRRVSGQGRVAVSFSGGLDSSLLAALASRHAEVVLCSAYAAGARDERQSDRAAALLGLRLESATLEEKSLARAARNAVLPPGESTVMDEALWCIYSATSRLAAANGARTIILGQLADELFGGYMKYALAAKEKGGQEAERMMREDVRRCADRGFLRDEAACSAFCEVRFPYADERIASFAAGLPLDYKVRGGERKAVLRAAALELGLPEELATAPKKAAQFSSGAARLLKRR